MKELFRHLPKKHQIFLLRNWGKLSLEKMAKTLSIDITTIIAEAAMLGLPDISVDSDWQEKGYITIIRNNWDLLTLEQIANIFDWSVQTLNTLLIEEDFLLTKLGGMRKNSPLSYQSLTENDILTTKKVSVFIKNYFSGKNKVKPFDFYTENISTLNFNKQGDNKQIKISFSYSMLFGDILMEIPEKSFPDAMLKRYKNIGINGLWIPVILYKLNPFFFDLSYSKDYDIRINNLNEIITRAGKYGIKVYLYLNEPRGMSGEFFNKYPQFKGTHENGIFALCTSNASVRKYLTDGVEYLCKNVKDIGGIITITMSENLTNCYSREGEMCPVCAKRQKTEVIAEVNNLIYDGIKKAGSNAKLIVWNWAWTSPKWSMEDNEKVIDLIPKDTIFMCVSEDEFAFEKGNVKGMVQDYSISNVGPSDKSRELFEYAVKNGHETMAKIQINNSWECAFVPYIPVFNLVLTHLRNLNDLGVHNVMTCWSLGGYPSAGLDLINADFSKSDDEILNDFYSNHYGVKDKNLSEGIKLLSKGFTNFPFSLCILYNGTQNYNVSNLMYLNKTGMNASMVGFCYDELVSWIYPYKYDDYIELLQKLIDDWESGIKLIDLVQAENAQFSDLKRMIKTVYTAFKSMYNQAEYTAIRDGVISINNKKGRMLELINSEKKLAAIMLEMQREDARIGFEASNHYLFTENNLIEKIISCNFLEEQLKEQLNA